MNYIVFIKNPMGWKLIPMPDKRAAWNYRNAVADEYAGDDRFKVGGVEAVENLDSTPNVLRPDPLRQVRKRLTDYVAANVERGRGEADAWEESA